MWKRQDKINGTLLAISVDSVDPKMFQTTELQTHTWKKITIFSSSKENPLRIKGAQ